MLVLVHACILNSDERRSGRKETTSKTLQEMATRVKYSQRRSATPALAVPPTPVHKLPLPLPRRLQCPLARVVAFPARATITNHSALRGQSVYGEWSSTPWPSVCIPLHYLCTLSQLPIALSSFVPVARPLASAPRVDARRRRRNHTRAPPRARALTPSPTPTPTPILALLDKPE